MKTKPILSEHETALMMAAAVAEAKKHGWPVAISIVDDGGHLLAMTRLDIADFLGLTIETVCRILTKLKSEGLIALPSPHRVALLEPAQLRRLAGEPENALAPMGAQHRTIRTAVWPS